MTGDAKGIARRDGASSGGSGSSGFRPVACPRHGSDGVWLALKFSLPDAHQYMPGFTGSDSGTNSQFTAYAKGDLDCDGTLAEFIRSGRVGPEGDPVGNFQPYIVNELE